VLKKTAYILTSCGENKRIWFQRGLPGCFPFHCFAMAGIRAFAENHHLCSSKEMSV
jgi:hypothetical protein